VGAAQSALAVCRCGYEVTCLGRQRRDAAAAGE
jgi:hypothetical protein